jgi:hypothetical protein
VLRVECTKCDRKGRYRVAKLIEKHGRNGNMMKWREMLNAECPLLHRSGRHPNKRLPECYNLLRYRCLRSNA